MPHKNPAERRAWYVKYRANWSPEKKQRVSEQSKRAKKKYRANLGPEKRQRERERTNQAVKKYFANLSAEKTKEVRQRRQQAGRKHNIKRYGITFQQFDELLTAQNGACAICGRTDSGRKPGNGRSQYLSENLHIDHCHKTYKVRGLLCDRCNVGLGRFNDDPNLLRLAIAYLERFG